MSKFQTLWEYVKNSDRDELFLSFTDIEAILGFPIDHSFLTYKKELGVLGFAVTKISLKNRTVLFSRI
jgi:hypothetical protein